MSDTRTPTTITFVVWYTNAPVVYDDLNAITLATAEKSGYCDTQGNGLRKVGVLPQNSKWQENRYRSGMYACYTEDEVKAIMEG